jgi:hypothetical protein
MKGLLKLILIIYPIMAIGQYVPDNLKISVDSDTSFWFNYQMKNLKQVNLRPLSDYDGILNLRITYIGQVISSVIDINQKNDSTFHIETIFHTKEVARYDETKTQRIYYEFDTIDCTIAGKIIEKYNSYNIGSI